MKKLLNILILSLLTVSASRGFAFERIVENLKCEMLSNPIGIDVTKPRLSWQLNSEKRDTRQVSYQIIVASTADRLAKNDGDLWNSGKINADQSILVPYAGKSLGSRQECFWKVKVWTNHSEEDWSEPAHFTVGLLKPEDWKAKWIGLDKAFSWDSVTKFSRLSARYFRKEFSGSQVKRATVYISGLGLYELYVNGKKVIEDISNTITFSTDVDTASTAMCAATSPTATCRRCRPCASKR